MGKSSEFGRNSSIAIRFWLKPYTASASCSQRYTKGRLIELSIPLDLGWAVLSRIVNYYENSFRIFFRKFCRQFFLWKIHLYSFVNFSGNSFEIFRRFFWEILRTYILKCFRIFVRIFFIIFFGNLIDDSFGLFVWEFQLLWGFFSQVLRHVLWELFRFFYIVFIFRAFLWKLLRPLKNFHWILWEIQKFSIGLKEFKK